MKTLSKAFLIVLCIISLMLVAATAYRNFYLVPRLKEPVLAMLKDPDSAEFRHVRYYGDWTISGGNLCGEVNARNAMGGYAGYAKFYASSAWATVEDESLPMNAGYIETDCLAASHSGQFWWLRW